MKNNVLYKLERFERSSEQTFEEFTPEENRVVAALITMGLLNGDAFRLLSSPGEEVVFEPLRGAHPFTPVMDAELGKSWYDDLSEMRAFRVIRDTFAILGFLASIVLAVGEITGRI